MNNLSQEKLQSFISSAGKEELIDVILTAARQNETIFNEFLTILGKNSLLSSIHPLQIESLEEAESLIEDLSKKKIFLFANIKEKDIPESGRSYLFSTTYNVSVHTVYDAYHIFDACCQLCDLCLNAYPKTAAMHIMDQLLALAISVKGGRELNFMYSPLTFLSLSGFYDQEAQYTYALAVRAMLTFEAADGFKELAQSEELFPAESFSALKKLQQKVSRPQQFQRFLYALFEANQQNDPRASALIDAAADMLSLDHLKKLTSLPGIYSTSIPLQRVFQNRMMGI